jgi:hypothetical protein
LCFSLTILSVIVSKQDFFDNFTVPTTSAKMKLTLLLLSAAAAVIAQTLDTVSATASGACEPHNDHWYTTLTGTFSG